MNPTEFLAEVRAVHNVCGRANDCPGCCADCADTPCDVELLVCTVEAVLALGPAWGKAEPENDWAHGYRDAVRDVLRVVEEVLEDERHCACGRLSDDGRCGNCGDSDCEGVCDE